MASRRELVQRPGGADHRRVRPRPPRSDPLPYEGYLRVSIAEGFLGQRRHWAKDRVPALHGGVTLSHLGAPPQEFTTVEPQDTWEAPGVTLNRPITPLIPYNGGTVTVQAGLYRVPADGPLDAAIQVVSSLSDLLGPPLSTAADIAGRVSGGLDRVLGNLGEQPVLGVNWTLATGSLQEGHIVVVNAPDAPVEFLDGRLKAAPGQDFLVLRLECRTERTTGGSPISRRSSGAPPTPSSSTETTRSSAISRTAAVAAAWNSPTSPRSTASASRRPSGRRSTTSSRWASCRVSSDLTGFRPPTTRVSLP